MQSFLHACAHGPLDQVQQGISDFSGFHRFLTQTILDSGGNIISQGLTIAYEAKYVEAVAILAPYAQFIPCYNLFLKACSHDSLEMVKALLKFKQDTWIAAGWSNACKSGNVPVVKYFLQVEPHLDLIQGFQWACLHQHLTIAQMLFQHGVVAHAAAHSNLAVENCIKYARAANWIELANAFSRKLQVMTWPLAQPIEKSEYDLHDQKYCARLDCWQCIPTSETFCKDCNVLFVGKGFHV